MLAQTDCSLIVGNWHHVKLVVTKTSLAGYVDDIEMFDVEHAEWTDGRVGIQAYSGMMDFDNFVVYGKGPYATSPNPPDGALHSDTWVNLNWSPGAFAVSHDVYLGGNFSDVEEAMRDSDVYRGNQLTKMYVAGFPGFAYPDGLVPGTTYYWRIDEVNDADPNSPWKGPVWSFSIPPQTAYNPDPADGAEFVGPEDVTLSWTPGTAGAPRPANRAVDVQHTPILTWTPAENASSHQVYFGMDKEAVKNATTDSPEYIGSRALGSESYEPGKLDWHTSYYWRVDAVYGANTVKGLVWSFTTADFLLIDDFESYTDDDAAGEAIWQHWIDGFGIADNGAQVGYLMPPYAEQTIVHGGAQSMPLLYANETGVTNSEAVLTLTAPRDWTAEGVGQLSLWVRGNVANAAEPLYVAIANSSGAPAVVAHDDANAAQKASWRQWIIPLQAFADQGINLTNVNSITIGLGSKSGVAAVGGSGTIYIDDIRLFRQ